MSGECQVNLNLSLTLVDVKLVDLSIQDDTKFDIKTWDFRRVSKEDFEEAPRASAGGVVIKNNPWRKSLELRVIATSASSWATPAFMLSFAQSYPDFSYDPDSGVGPMGNGSDGGHLFTSERDVRRQ